jgi:hypothetical protein
VEGGVAFTWHAEGGLLGWGRGPRMKHGLFPLHYNTLSMKLGFLLRKCDTLTANLDFVIKNC